jgi:pilus assembly protein CpaC
MTHERIMHEHIDAAAARGSNRNAVLRRIGWPIALLAAGVLLAIGSTAEAQSAGQPAYVTNVSSPIAVSVELGKAEVMAAPGPGATVFIANPDVADVQTPDSKRVVIFGKKSGETSAYIFTAGGGMASYAITVRRPAGDVAQALRTQVPGAKVEVARGPAGMTVSGRAASPAQAEALKAVAQQYLEDKEHLNFAVGVDGSTQVNLQVRVAEVSRQVTKNLGFNWNALFNNGTVAVGLLTGREPTTALSTGVFDFGQFVRDTSQNALDSIGVGYKNGPVNMSALIDALQSNGMITILAEPNLTAISGATASFLDGGEIPIPISQGLNQITIEWKKFGVSVDFTPTVLNANRISVRVRPEVSELSNVGAVVINGLSVPSLTVRRAETTVELGSGESFAIAGLFQNNMSDLVQQYPGLGAMPILGPLFRSSSFTRNESELVIIVTPYIVRPVARPSDLHAPTEAAIYSNDLERMLLGRVTPVEAPATVADGSPHLTGPAGFMLEEQP